MKTATLHLLLRFYCRKATLEGINTSTSDAEVKDNVVGIEAEEQFGTNVESNEENGSLEPDNEKGESTTFWYINTADAKNDCEYQYFGTSLETVKKH